MQWPILNPLDTSKSTLLDKQSSTRLRVPSPKPARYPLRHIPRHLHMQQKPGILSPLHRYNSNRLTHISAFSLTQGAGWYIKHRCENIFSSKNRKRPTERGGGIEYLENRSSQTETKENEKASSYCTYSIAHKKNKKLQPSEKKEKKNAENSPFMPHQEKWKWKSFLHTTQLPPELVAYNTIQTWGY